MEEKKYGKVLTIILIIVVIGVLILLSFLGFDVYKKFENKKESEEMIAEFENSILNIVNDNQDNTNTELPNVEAPPTENNNNINENPGTTPTKPQYQGKYNMEGIIEIPAINLKYTILEKATPSSIEVAVAIMYSENGLNKPGNTVIVGHNYRNGDFFGNNDRLKVGDKVYITDNSGTKIKYNIYNIYETSPDDSDFIVRETNGKREISLSTCTDNSKGRLIIWAVEE